MSNIKIKLKEDSYKDFLTTPNGIVVGKDDYVVIDDENIHSQYLLNRDDIIMQDVAEDKKSAKKSKVIKDEPDKKDGVNEGSVSETITDNDMIDKED